MKITNVIALTFGLVILAYIGICFWLYKYQEKLLFFPQQLSPDYTFEFSGNFEEVFLDTPDDVRIHGIYFKAENPKGVILAFHGNGEALHLAGHEAVDFVVLGYDVLMSDYRSYGKSGGKLSEANLFNDAKLFYQHLISKGWIAEEITIYGRSIGSGVASYLASQVTHKQLILTTLYFSMYDLAQKTYPVVPMSIVLRYPLRNDLHLQKVSTPIHIFHGTNDSIIPFEQAEKLYTLVGSNGSFTVVDGGEHNNLSSFSSYWENMRSVLDAP